jgi:hypothetical protein
VTRRRRLQVKIRKSDWRMVRQMRNRDGRKLWRDLRAAVKEGR